MHVALVHSGTIEGDWVECALGQLRHDVVRFFSLDALLRTVHQTSYDLVVLHNGLSRAHSLDALAVLRARQQHSVPLLVYGSTLDSGEIAKLLNGGADDYVDIPTGAAVFAARVTALLRRVYPASFQQTSFTIGNFEISPFRRVVEVCGEQADLTDTETRLALLLFTNMDRTLSRNHIFALVWGRTTLQMTRTIDTHISRLRLKLGLHEENGVRLRAVYNVGYRLERVAHQGIDQLTDPMLSLALQA